MSRTPKLQGPRATPGVPAPARAAARKTVDPALPRGYHLDAAVSLAHVQAGGPLGVRSGT
ncbi:MAG: hypothetical protein ABSH07_06435 [Candidatus Dormibacteria bacterium]